MAKPIPRLNTQHDFISIDFGNGRRLTTSYGGQKATGAVPRVVFDAFCAMIKAKAVEGVVDVTFGVRVQKFADNIATIWPDWNKAPKTFKVGDTVSIDFGKRRGGIDTGKVYKVSRTNYFVDWQRSGKIGVTGDMLTAANP